MNILAMLQKNNQPRAAAPPAEQPPTPTPIAPPPNIPQVVQPAEPPAATPPAAPVVEVAQVVEGPKKRAFPEQRKPKPPAAATPAPVVVVEQAPAACVVYVGCLPVGKSVKSIERWLQDDTDLVERYEKSTRQNYLEDQYNNGVKLIAAELLALIKQGKLDLPAALLLSKDSMFHKYLFGEFSGLEGVTVVVSF